MGRVLCWQNLESLDSARLHRIYEIHNYSAKDRLKVLDRVYVENQETKEGKVLLVVKFRSEKHRGLSETTHFVKEEGVWKIGE